MRSQGFLRKINAELALVPRRLLSALLRVEDRLPAEIAFEDGAPQVIIPNLHWRYTGVTVSARSTAPLIAAKLATAWIGPHGPDELPRAGFSDLLRLRSPVVWHARRNNEMLLGLLMRFLGWPIRLVFTSSAQRRHSLLTRFLIQRMDGVVATTAVAASYLRRPAAVIQHGVDTARYCPPDDGEEPSAPADLSGQIGIGCFGRLRYQKGTDVFVHAMCELLPRHPKATAIIIGPITKKESSYTNGLLCKIRDAGLSGRIHILGELPPEEVVAWYQRISIYAFTSRVEGFGLTLLEAMASGNAVIASRAGAADLAIEDGTHGLLIPPGDVEALVAGLERLLNSPALRRDLGRKARERVVSGFSVEEEARALAGLYASLLEK